MARSVQNIRINHEGEDGIEKSVPRITIWHHIAYQVMTISDHKGQIYDPIITSNNGFPEVPKYTEMQYHKMMSL